MANPFVTVVILTTGDAPNVVQDLNAQTYKNFEILFAREKGIVSAMNIALARAKGDIFVRVDDDVMIPKTWLQELVAPFDLPSVAGVTGPTFVPKHLRANRDSIRIWEKPNRFLRWLKDGRDFAPAKIYKCGMVSYDSNYEEKFGWGRTCGWFTVDHLEGTNWAMRTALIRSVGGFDPAFDGVAEWFDTDVEQKVAWPGVNNLVYNPRAFLYHMLDFTEHYSDRFEAWGRIKNWLRFHIRHSKFHWKMVVYLLVWTGYFISKGIKCKSR
jgi:GT2 family glycosyltransferase